MYRNHSLHVFYKFNCKILLSIIPNSLEHIKRDPKMSSCSQFRHERIIFSSLSNFRVVQNVQFCFLLNKQAKWRVQVYEFNVQAAIMNLNLEGKIDFPFFYLRKSRWHREMRVKDFYGGVKAVNFHRQFLHMKRIKIIH